MQQSHPTGHGAETKASLVDKVHINIKASCAVASFADSPEDRGMCFFDFLRLNQNFRNTHGHSEFMCHVTNHQLPKENCRIISRLLLN